MDEKGDSYVDNVESDVGGKVIKLDKEEKGYKKKLRIP